VHRGLQADGVSDTADFGPSAANPFCTVTFVASHRRTYCEGDRTSIRSGLRSGRPWMSSTSADRDRRAGTPGPSCQPPWSLRPGLEVVARESIPSREEVLSDRLLVRVAVLGEARAATMTFGVPKTHSLEPHLVQSIPNFSVLSSGRMVRDCALSICRGPCRCQRPSATRRRVVPRVRGATGAWRNARRSHRRCPRLSFVPDAYRFDRPHGEVRCVRSRLVALSALPSPRQGDETRSRRVH
jgi:hypothetical protein